MVGHRRRQHGRVRWRAERLKHRRRPCFHRGSCWPNHGLGQPEEIRICDDGHAAGKCFEGSERLSLKPRRQEHSAAVVQQGQPFRLRQPAMTRPTISLQRLASSQVQVNRRPLLPDRGEHIEREIATLHGCIASHHQEAFAFLPALFGRPMHRMDRVGHNVNRADHRFKHIFPRRIEDHHGVNVTLDG